MSKKSILLSAAGLKNIIKDDNDFIFAFGEHEIRLSNIFAEFISPIVSHLHLSDPTINKIHYNYHQTSKISNFEDLFTEQMISNIQLISSGSLIELTEKESHQMRLISILLCNEELFNKIDEIYPIENSKEETEKYIKELEILNIVKNMTNDIFIDFKFISSMISKNFYLVDKNRIKTLSKTLFYSIISNENLKIENEDSLFDIIIDYFKVNNNNDDFPDIISFYEEIEINNLSEQKFIEMMKTIDPSKITGKLWQNICKRICKEDKDDESKMDRYSKQQQQQQQPKSSARIFSFNGKEENKLKGIINFLTEEAGGNVHDKGIISVTSSSVNDNEEIRLAKNVVDFHRLDSRLLTKNEKNSWLKYDFKNMKVKPTHYSIRSKPFGSTDFHPKNWVIEGSNNDNKWKILDSRNDVTSLCARSVLCTFEIRQKGENNEYFRYLRLRQTGSNASGDNRLGLSSLEYFGSII